MFSVEDLYRDDIGGAKVISVSGGRELRGPCPGCGGDDRFGVFPRQNNGEGSYYCGRHKGAGNGCGKGGDIIQYLRDFRQMSYTEACRYLGKEPKGGGAKHLKYMAPAMPKTRVQGPWQPEDKDYPEDVVNPALWREHGMKFVDSCHQALLDRPTAIAYLMTRGITLDGIKKFKLGFHHGEVRNGADYEPSFRPWPSWGLKDEKKANGRHRMIILPAGLVIPYVVDGDLHRITIRLFKKDPQQPKKKYHYVKGSKRDVWLTGANLRAHVVIEAELDCIALDCVAGDLVGTIGIGSTGVRPDTRAAAAIADDICILGSLDFDAPRKNPRTGRIERPGADGGRWWRETYPQYRRWPVPQGKDIGEAFELGVDLRSWVMAGLPPSMQLAGVEGMAPAAVRAPAAEKKEVLLKSHAALQVAELAEERRAAEIIQKKRFPPTDDLRELRTLLAECRGFFRIADRGMTVGPEIDRDWSTRNPEKRRRITDLLHRSDSVGVMIENLADGLYGSANIPV